MRYQGQALGRGRAVFTLGACFQRALRRSRTPRANHQGNHQIHILRARWMLLAVLVMPRLALAGPPFVTDDPEPTDTGHFEDYLYTQGALVSGEAFEPGVGIEIDYGAFANTQLTLTLPLNPTPGPGGMGLVWAPLGGGVKYRFIQEDHDGWRPQVAIFPQIFIPVGSATRGTPTTELLPIWIQKSFGTWTSFGGGGYTNNPGPANRNYIIYGWALQRQVTDTLALGGEVFGQTPDAVGTRARTAVGLAALYDFSKTWHLIGSVNTGIVDARQSDQFSFNLAVKWTR